MENVIIMVNNAADVH